MHGNRDFLVGSSMMTACNIALLADPVVLNFNHQRWVLSHGDALCLGDTAYMAFRQQVRSTEWQQAFLVKPLAERQAIARGLRQQSEARKKSGAEYADVCPQAARQLLVDANASTLIHGHTHKPAAHDLGNGLKRVVLSDWDAAATPPRAEVMRLSNAGLQRIPLINQL
jgi:UDP-2,3-diacylglucosamine hydrolase